MGSHCYLLQFFFSRWKLPCFRGRSITMTTVAPQQANLVCVCAHAPSSGQRTTTQAPQACRKKRNPSELPQDLHVGEQRGGLVQLVLKGHHGTFTDRGGFSGQNGPPLGNCVGFSPFVSESTRKPLKRARHSTARGVVNLSWRRGPRDAKGVVCLLHFDVPTRWAASCSLQK